MARKFDDPASRIRQCDEEHAVQLALIDAVRRSLSEYPVGPRAVFPVDRLIRFTRTHFLSERMLMRLCCYPEVDVHLAEHDRLEGVIRDLARDWPDGESGALEARVVVLRTAITEHIATFDRKFVAYHQQCLASDRGPGEPSAP